MTASQVALTESMSSLVGPSRESVRYVVSHAPVLVSPQAERAEIFYSDDVLETPNASSLSISPFADAIPPVGVTDAAERAVGCEDVRISTQRSRAALTICSTVWIDEKCFANNIAVCITKVLSHANKKTVGLPAC